ncbi:MAG: 1-deoxy-D-xylulose-5-phosphate synthase [Bacilli bacterium]|nr:1-deoxy-D-xylulose-5-phosphate synthase [Bacilli bacterium]
MMKLEEITSPEFLKSMSVVELEALAKEIREYILHTVSQTGGHLSSNLGVVELTIALHYVFQSPHDKLIFDVGHQGYTHKILTGRAKDFPCLRQKNGLNGFFKYSESPHDVWEAGHSSTSIAAACGFLEAKASGANIGEVVAIIGDGAIQNGLALSSLNYLAGKSDHKAIIILNDNEMSISKNVGGLAKIFNNIRIKKSYRVLKQITPRFIKHLFDWLKRGLISIAYKDRPLTIGAEYKYFGPIDGHDLKGLIKYFTFAKNTNRSVFLHIKTTKGKGYPYAEADKVGIWHGVGPFDIATGNPLKESKPGHCSWSIGISELLFQKAQQNPLIKVISSATICGSELNQFVRELPEQIIDVGISEENAVVMATAMAKEGLIPIIPIYATFLQRAYDELSHDVARTNAHVIFLVDRAGIVTADGNTHQGTFDIAFLSHLPNFIITMPKDLSQAEALFDLALITKAPFVIRYPKYNTKKITTETTITLGKWEEVLPLQAINVVTYGPVVDKFKEIITEDGITLGLINALFIRPLDEELLKKLAHKKIIVYEEVIGEGSLAQAIAYHNTINKLNIDIDVYNIKYGFLEVGTVKQIKKDLGLDIREIIEKYR